ncbi:MULTISPECIES: DNA primase [unclassified Streptomyces]|uniref:DNA primase n=1 Tax=unclassified Streptomyces TaxID=2593676 RepID=UPI0036FF119A
MNRTGLGLAIGAGYLLGRTRKLKLAVAVGGLVAGKKLNLGPRMVAELVSQQLRDNPQFKEIGDQLRGDLRGVGKAASGALVERRLASLADRLHGRTAELRGRSAGAGPQEDEAEEEEEETPAERTAGKAPTGATARRTAKKAPARRAAPEKRTARAKKAVPAKKTAAKKAVSKRGGER